MTSPRTFTAFHLRSRVAAGTLAAIAEALHTRGLRLNRVLVFDDVTGDLIKLNTETDLQAANADPADARSDTAPVAMEVRVLGRDRAWLERQPGGASAAIRRLVAAARRDPAMQAREARDAAYRFIAMLAGDLPGYEEACRALFAGDRDRFEAATDHWETDVRDHALRLGWRTPG